MFLSRLAASVDVSRMTRRAVTGRKDVTRDELDSFIGALRRLDEQVGRGMPGHRAGAGAVRLG